jgi:flagellar basal body rod protein FlgG
MKLTGQPLDLAIQGPGFFRIMTPNGERYTRDGRFQRGAAGSLVTIDGYQVLDSNRQPIQLAEGDLSITGDGTLLINDKPAGQLGLAAFTNPAQELQRDLPNTFRAASAPTAAGTPSGTQKGTVQQGYLEMSNASPAQLMTQMVAVSRAYEAAQQMVATQDELVGKTISSLSRL